MTNTEIDDRFFENKIQNLLYAYYKLKLLNKDEFIEEYKKLTGTNLIWFNELLA